MIHKSKNDALNAYLQSLLGKDFSAYLEAPGEPSAIRINTLKSTNKQFLAFLDKNRVEYKKIPFNKDGYILKSDDLPLSHSLAFFEGAFQYQGLSSQLPAIVLNAKQGERVLDMAAAPGSKSTQLAALMGGQGELVLNDISRRRLQPLHVNMQRSGASNYYILKIRGENLSRLYPEYFDKILVDAPCTALGTLSTNNEVFSWWSLEKLKKLSKIQYQMLLSAIKSLKVGGELVYSTCSIAPEENELLIEQIIHKFPVKIIDIPENIHSQFNKGWTLYNEHEISKQMNKATRIWPHSQSMEGFFVIKLKKTDRLEKTNLRKPVPMRNTLSSDNPEIEKILENLSFRWGIPDDVWKSFRYILTKSKIWMIGKGIEKIPIEGFVSGGLLLGEKRISGWKLVNSSVQVLSEHISKGRISITDQALKILFREGEVKVRNLDADYYILDVNGKAVGSLYHKDGTVRLHLPHAFNLVI
jgi:16S rRNA (cytosine1407-C5)-methyltransferase